VELDKDLARTTTTVNKWYEASMTHCYITAGVMHRLTGDILFNRPSTILLDSEKTSIPEKEEQLKEMSSDELKLYRFRTTKGNFCHVFTVIKFPQRGDPIFFLYQSYLDHYSLHHFMHSSDFRPYSLKELDAHLLTPLRKMGENLGVWNDRNYEEYARVARASMTQHEKTMRVYPESCQVFVEVQD
jgi:hypothetical protein